MDYNKSHPADLIDSPWSSQFCRMPFPRYWRLVYGIMDKIDRNCKILEIGCGQGDVTAILCYLGFKHILSYEKNAKLAKHAERRIYELFKLKDIIVGKSFPDGNSHNADVLLLVNCAYKDMAQSKEDYLQLMKDYYISAGKPAIFIMEVIDATYKEIDDDFPKYIRLTIDDVKLLFADYEIECWPTYSYPVNRKSKTLYLISVH